MINEVFFSTALTSTGWVLSLLSFVALSLLSINTALSESFMPEFLLKLWTHDSNPGRLGVERERYLCAMPLPMKFQVIEISALFYLL